MNKIKVFMLITNENCNLNCTYCYEHHKTTSYMSFTTAKSIIDKEFSTATSGETFEIEFFGGEPFLNFPLIKQIVDYVKSKYSNLKVYFNAHLPVIFALPPHRDNQKLYRRRTY